jgi:hypothetical protein
LIWRAHLAKKIGIKWKTKRGSTPIAIEKQSPYIDEHIEVAKDYKIIILENLAIKKSRKFRQKRFSQI